MLPANEANVTTMHFLKWWWQAITCTCTKLKIKTIKGICFVLAGWEKVSLLFVLLEIDSDSDSNNTINILLVLYYDWQTVIFCFINIRWCHIEIIVVDPTPGTTLSVYLTSINKLFPFVDEFTPRIYMNYEHFLYIWHIFYLYCIRNHGHSLRKYFYRSLIYRIIWPWQDMK